MTRFKFIAYAALVLSLLTSPLYADNDYEIDLAAPSIDKPSTAPLTGVPLLAASYAANNTYQIILDAEDPCFEFLSGDWELGYSGIYIGYYYFTIPGPGTGEAKGRWIAEGLPSGDYLIEFYCKDDDYPAAAQYTVECATGTEIKLVNMNYVGTGWHSLGTFSINRTCAVSVSDEWVGAGSLMYVDALRFTLTNPPLPAPPDTPTTPHIGICIDDVGSANPADPSTPLARMLKLPFNMTYAIIPHTTYADASSEAIVAAGSEPILHQPMAAISIADPGHNAIIDSMTLEEVRTTLAQNLESIPHLVGMNNHTGSLITQQADKMNACMEVLVERNQFFLDSRTITQSVGYDASKAAGLVAGERDIFIDGNSKTEAMTLIRNLALRALYAPHVPHIGIGHVRSNTAAALEEMVPEIEAMGVEVWPVSRCLRKIVEVDYQPIGATFMASGAGTLTPDRYSKMLRKSYAMSVVGTPENPPAMAEFCAVLPWDGTYTVYAAWGGDFNENAESVSCTVSYWEGAQHSVTLDQTKAINDWQFIGRFPFKGGEEGCVRFTDDPTRPANRATRTDAVKFVYNSSETTYDCWAAR